MGTVLSIYTAPDQPSAIVTLQIKRHRTLESESCAQINVEHLLSATHGSSLQDINLLDSYLENLQLGVGEGASEQVQHDSHVKSSNRKFFPQSVSQSGHAPQLEYCGTENLQEGNPGVDLHKINKKTQNIYIDLVA